MSDKPLLGCESEIVAGELFHRKALFDSYLPLAEYSSLEVSLWESGLVGGYGAVLALLPWFGRGLLVGLALPILICRRLL